MAGKEPVLNREKLVSERKKIISNLVLTMTAFFIVLLAFGTMAWFTHIKEVKSDGMQIAMIVPEGVQISPGRTGMTENGTTTDLYLNHPDDVLMTEYDASRNIWKVLEPRNNVDGDEYDWAERIYIGNYYSFGRLLPASSTSGEYVFFTPDAIKTGRELKENARFYLASGYYSTDGIYYGEGKTDGALKDVLGKSITNETDSDLLMTTAHAYTGNAEKQTSFWEGYQGKKSWYDTNDDGYFVDIPIWFRTNYKVSVPLGVEGYITKKDGSLVTGDDSDGEQEALYKAVRVAFFVWNEEDKGYVSAGAKKNGVERNIIPLQNEDSFGETAKSTADSENYTITRDPLDARQDKTLYGVELADATNKGLIQEQNYAVYQTFGSDNDTVMPNVLVLEPSNDSQAVSWSTPKKMLVRVWLDGDDKDCRNATAGQDWCIHLRFFIIENQQ